MNQKLTTRQIALIGMLAGISAVLMYVKFPLPFMPPFMDYDPSAIVEMVGGFALGPIAAVLIVILKILLKLALQGTSSAFTGEIQNILISCAYVVPAAVIYRFGKNKKAAIKGMLVGVMCSAVVASLTNVYMIIPFYVELMGMSMDSIIGMTNKLNANVTDMTSLVFWGIIPFNLIKFGVNSLITALIYKKVSVPMKRILN